MSDNKVAAANAANVSSTEETPIIFLDDVKVTFNTRTGSLLHPNKVQALRGITLKLMKGETLGIVGESAAASPRQPTSSAACRSPRAATCTSRAATSPTAPLKTGVPSVA